MKQNLMMGWAGNAVIVALVHQVVVARAANPRLLAYWDFNDASKPIVATDKVYGFQGTLEGGAVFSPAGTGRSGAGSDRAVDYGSDGAGERVRVSRTPFLNVAAAQDQMTIVFWEKLTDVAAATAFWGVSPSSNQGQRGISALAPWSDGTVYFDSAGCCDGTQRINKKLGAGFDVTGWHHYAFVKDGGLKQIWIDGVRFHVGTGAAPLPTDFTRLVMGASDTGSNNVRGAQDDFAVFAGALDGTQIAALAAGAAPDKLAGVDVSATPLIGGASATPTGFVLDIAETVGNPVRADTLVVRLDGAVVTASSVSKAGTTTSVSYGLPAGSYFASGSSHSVDVSIKDSQGTVTTGTRTFAVVSYKLLAAASRVTPDTSKPGFQWNVHQNDALQENDNQRPEDQLAGRLIDSTTSRPYANTANAGYRGAALAPATPARPAWAPLRYEIATVINLSQVEGEKNGDFTPDLGMPGIGADLNGIAAEIVTYIELPAGLVTMGVNSDDGFRMTAGQPLDVFQGVNVGEFSGSRGASDSIFAFVVPEAGVYPFRMVYQEGGGGASIEWFTVRPDGTKVLVNDTAKGGYKAYRATTTSLPPYVRAVSPSPAPRQLDGVSPAFEVTLSDGASERVDDASVVLRLDGREVATTLQRNGKLLTLTHKPEGLQIPSEPHRGELSFRGTAGSTRSETWSFRNLKNLVLPKPRILETFDTYPQDTQPTGWVAWNFTAHCSDGRDITSQTSESYENWVLTDVSNIPDIDGGLPFDISPGQFIEIDGKRVELLNADPPGGTFPAWIMSGNVLYAESDGRCNADSRGAAGFPNNGQSQFITTKPYDVSAFRGVVVTFSSIYQQNQDSMGAVEYSVDGGRSWLPVMYFLEEPDIRIKTDGTVDAVATFNAANPDTSSWVVDGRNKGDRYGDGIAAPITDALGDHVVPRINDGQAEGNRVEVARLDRATGKSDVRLRFAAMGTDSWYFAIDNLAFYDVAAPGGAGGPPALSIARSGLSVVITFEGRLQQADSPAGPWTAVGGSSPMAVGDPSGDRYYRAVR